MPFPRPCAETDCPLLTAPGERRCEKHQRAWDRKRAADPAREPYRDPGYRRTRAVLLRSGAPCAHCGTYKNLTVDHVIPLSAGGTHAPENLQILCRSCNSRKGNQ